MNIGYIRIISARLPSASYKRRMEKELDTVKEELKRYNIGLLTVTENYEKYFVVNSMAYLLKPVKFSILSIFHPPMKIPHDRAILFGRMSDKIHAYHYVAVVETLFKHYGDKIRLFTMYGTSTYYDRYGNLKGLVYDPKLDPAFHRRDQDVKRVKHRVRLYGDASKMHRVLDNIERAYVNGELSDDELSDLESLILDMFGKKNANIERSRWAEEMKRIIGNGFKDYLAEEDDAGFRLHDAEMLVSIVYRNQGEKRKNMVFRKNAVKELAFSV
ncbi:MAG: hypothetical protein GXO26_01225 [Crenarchaeota archaeon]|nr:hypothetical protein [Thermoproteota archaeon]